MQLKSICLLLAFSGSMLYHPPSNAGEFGSQRELQFLTNNGQIIDQYHNRRADIDFQLKAHSGLNVFVSSTGLHYQWATPATETPQPASRRIDSDSLQLLSKIKMYRMDVTLMGANAAAQILTEEKSSYSERHYTPGSDGSLVESFRKITYKNIYPNIDWVLFLKNQTLEYEFIVHPGGKPTDIKIAYGGCESLHINKDGSLTARTPLGTINEKAPFSFDEIGNIVHTAFRQNGNIISFEVADGYNGVLTIDPAIEWATYFGGTLYDRINQIATDQQGSVYATGATASTANIATTGSYQYTYAGGTGGASYLGDAFLTKFDAAGNCIWSTYFGGPTIDQGWGVAIDYSGKPVISGITNSNADISSPGAWQSALAGGYDNFLAKFDTSGQRIWSTYFGGTGNENTASSVATDTAGNIYLAGLTNSANGISTPGAYQTTIGAGNDCFLAKFDSLGNRDWATYYGGNSHDYLYSVRSDTKGNLYICGYTRSTTGIATANVHQAALSGMDDGFLARFDNSGQLVWGTYYGGPANDRVYGLAINDSGMVYTLGGTGSATNIASPNAYQTAPGDIQDIYFAKFDSTGQRIWGSYFGGPGTETAYSGIGLGITGDIYISGGTGSTSTIATPGAFKQTLEGSTDIFLCRFTPGGQRVWGSYVGGTDLDQAFSLSTDHLGNVYVAGQTNSSTGIATAQAHQASFSGGMYDGALIKIADCDTPVIAVPLTGPSMVCPGGSYTYSVAPVANATTYLWTLPGGWSGSSTTSSITVTASDSAGFISVAAANGCTAGIPDSLQVDMELVATINPSGNHAICDQDSLLLTAPNDPSYTWNWLLNGQPVNGATTHELYATQAGSYAVVVSNGTCTDTSAVDTLTVHALPNPVITQTGMDLSTDSFVSYQWSYNGTPITGATGQTHTAIADGDYSVTVTDTNGCTATSASFTVITSIREIQKSRITVYPNPATTQLHIDSENAIQGQVLSLDGRVVMQLHNGANNIEALTAGVYTIQLFIDGEQALNTRLVKLNQ